MSSRWAKLVHPGRLRWNHGPENTCFVEEVHLPKVHSQGPCSTSHVYLCVVTFKTVVMLLSLGSRAYGLSHLNAAGCCRQTLRRVAMFRLSEFSCRDRCSNAAVTEAAYAGCSLSQITPQLRGRVLERVAKEVFQRQNPHITIQDPVPGYRCNGTRRALTHAECDWISNGRRVQCKSSRLSWYGRCWQFCFTNIKPSLSDELFLVLYSPQQLAFIHHDGNANLVLNGKTTASRGHRLQFYAPSHIKCPDTAYFHLLGALKQSQFCKILVTTSPSNELVGHFLNSMLQSQGQQLQIAAYQNHPFAAFSPTMRGLIWQDIVQQIDERYHGSPTVKEHPGSSCDWMRDNLRVECKHARMSWGKQKQAWFCEFSNIKPGEFDLMYLLLDSPIGGHILKFGGSSQYLHRRGKTEGVMGKYLRIFGPRQQTDWPEAAVEILGKLKSSGSEHIATVLH